MLIVALATIWPTAACTTKQAWNDPGPKDTYHQFLLHWFRGEPEVAFNYILPADRDVLTRGADAADDLPEQHRPKPWEMLVVANIDNVYDIARMDVSPTFETEPPEGQQVTVTTHRQDGSTALATLAWSDGKWFVDLPLNETSQ